MFWKHIKNCFNFILKKSIFCEISLQDCIKILFNFFFVWKLDWNIKRFLFCLKIEIKYYMISCLFKDWDIDKILLDFFCLKIEMLIRYYLISFWFENWDKILHDFFFVWKLRYWWNITRYLFCLKIALK